ncbi:hypothetical protein MRX96_009346 [Rhipicephalus microplus]
MGRRVNTTMKSARNRGGGGGLCGYAIAQSTNPFVFAMQALAHIIAQLLVRALLAASSDVSTCRERLGIGNDTVLLMRAAKRIQLSCCAAKKSRDH